MHGEVDASGGEGFFDFFGEDSFAESGFGADHGERDVGDFVAGGVDDFDFDFMAAGAQEVGDVVGLPQGELGAAGADAEEDSAVGELIVAGHRWVCGHCPGARGKSPRIAGGSASL